MPKIDELSSRRGFLKAMACSVVAPLAGSALLYYMPTAAAADNPHLKESDPIAKQLNYKQDASQVDNSKHEEGQLCNNCRYFKGSEGDEWGSCTIIPGKLVHAQGWCSSYTAK